ncbi:MAG: aspartate carbamoyltransferase [Proteobacteria bacterium]|nr:aspartate carbamoyltransferase [Pseudomonadota bacterium]
MTDHPSYKKHVLHADQFSRQDMESLFTLSDQVRDLAKQRKHVNFLQNLLSHKRAMLYFVQPSTRTFLSFQSACQYLGMNCSEIRNPSTSSEAKGEAIEDAIRTFSSYVDMIIMRSPVAKLCEKIAKLLDTTPRSVPIINAGSGPDQHPTQSLLDLYTLHRGFKDRGGIENKTICLVGDLKRSRTVRSLSKLLTHYPKVHLIFSSPQAFALKEDIRSEISQASSITFAETEHFLEAIEQADAIYMTRIQDEWQLDSQDSPPSLDVTSRYHLKYEHLKSLMAHTIIMHPFPRRHEIDPKIDNDPRAHYWKQERNGMWVRLALIAQVMNVSNAIHSRWMEKDHI